MFDAISFTTWVLIAAWPFGQLLSGHLLLLSLRSKSIPHLSVRMRLAAEAVSLLSEVCLVAGIAHLSYELSHYYNLLRTVIQ